jgi:hypothetical protein
MSGPGRGLLRVLCCAAALVLVGLLVFGVSTAGADPPVFDPQPDQTVEAQSASGATATFAVTATDDNGTPAISCDHNSGDVFPIGATNVNCTATDTTTGEVTGPQRILTITVVDTTAPTISTPGTLTAEATSPSGAAVTYTVTASDTVDGSVTPTCSPGSGATFGIGSTTVNCTAADSHGNNSSAQFVVNVQDSTPPSLANMPGNITAPATGSGGAVVNYSNPTASDIADPSPTVNCAPSSGSTFGLGVTTVSCTASDHSGNTSAAQTFTVTVIDNVNPSLTNMPGNINAPATGPGGATVGYALPSATDNVDPSPAVGCSPPPGSTFPLGQTTVTCTATDSSGNQATGTFTVTVADSAAPVLSNPGHQTAEATGPGGAAVSYSVSAVDNVDPSPAVSCTPASGSTFSIGTTTVNCTARDAANNTSTTNFTVTVADTTAPSFSNIPSPGVFEANGASGSAVGYASPTAVDLVSGAVPVQCTPPSGSGFPIGTTQVDCQAGDAFGNIRHVQFAVTVADRTPPVVSAPPFLAIYATTDTGVPSSDPSVRAAERLITARDNIDPSPVISSDIPPFLPVGRTIVHFFASDRYGNRAGTNMEVDVLPKPTGPAPPLPVPDATPPANVSNLAAKPGDRAVTLSWKLPGDKDLDHVTVYRSDPTSAQLGDPVYTGSATRFTNRGLVNDTQYRYVVVSYDGAGNRSVGLAILATPHIAKLISPVDGAKVRKPPVLKWRPVAEADYYNIQLFRGSGKVLAGNSAAAAQKILSVWPRGTKFALKAKWKFQGRTYRLTKGTYRWFVWPGFGARAQNSYGPVLGVNTFTVTR